MSKPPTILDVFDDALGRSPQQLVTASKDLGARELRALLQSRSDIRITHEVSPYEIWPLVSHHTYGAHKTLFGVGRSDILEQALTWLLIHDGLMIADPLDRVVRVTQEVGTDAGLHELEVVVSELAQVEALISAGVLRFTPLRPQLAAEGRSLALEAMGLDPGLRVFTNFAEAADTVRAYPQALLPAYLEQVSQLLTRFGLPVEPRSLDESEFLVRRLAASAIEVSWQIAVVANEPACDLAFRDPWDTHLAQALLEQELHIKLGPGRHFERLTIGAVPNLDRTALSASDAIAIRETDSFSQFRQTLRAALDRLDTATTSGTAGWKTRASFEEEMKEAAQLLIRTSKKSSISERFRAATVPIALGGVATFTAAAAQHQSGLIPGTAGAATALTTILVEWLLSRSSRKGEQAAYRYYAMLGGGTTASVGAL